MDDTKDIRSKKHAPEILERASYIMEAGDYLVSLLTGNNTRSNCGIGFKGFYNEQDGFNYNFLKQLIASCQQ